VNYVQKSTFLLNCALSATNGTSLRYFRELLTFATLAGINWRALLCGECCVMSTQTPPLAPKLTDNVTVHIVLNDFGKLGRTFLETDELEADEWTTVTNIINGEYSNPVRVVAFNIAEGWSRDVTEDVAEAVIERGDTEGHLSEPAKKFVECVLGEILR
jgi:hypothetical protein